MKNLIDMILRSPDDGGGSATNGDGNPPAGGDGTAPPAAAGTGGAGGDEPAAAAAAAAAAPAAAAADQVYKPEGLPDNLLGKTNQETIDNQAKALKGYRDRDAANNIPDTPDAYATFSDEIPADIKPHLDTLKADPLFARVGERALALKVPVPVYQGLVQEMLSVSAEMGLLEPVVNAEAERQELVPESAKHLPEAEQKQAIELRMNTNFAFLDAMVARGVANGGLSKEDADFAKAMLGDSAKGHRVFEWMAKTAGGSGSAVNMQQTQAAGGDERAQLRARAALPENTVGNPKFDQASFDQLEKDYQRVIGA